MLYCSLPYSWCNICFPCLKILFQGRLWLFVTYTRQKTLVLSWELWHCCVRQLVHADCALCNKAIILINKSEKLNCVLRSNVFLCIFTEVRTMRLSFEYLIRTFPVTSLKDKIYIYIWHSFANKNRCCPLPYTSKYITWSWWLHLKGSVPLSCAGLSCYIVYLRPYKIPVTVFTDMEAHRLLLLRYCLFNSSKI